MFTSYPEPRLNEQSRAPFCDNSKTKFSSPMEEIKVKIYGMTGLCWLEITLLVLKPGTHY